MFNFEGKGGGQNRGWHLEFICSYSEKLCVTRHWGNVLAAGWHWAPVWVAEDCSLAATVPEQADIL